MTNLKKIFCCSFFLAVALFSHAQKQTPPTVIINGLSSLLKDSTHKLHVKDILVTGARKTKIYIVLREVPLKKGDSILRSNLEAELQLARQQVYNILPVPQFQLVDRNFNVWAKTYHYSFDRVNYGIKFVHYNLSGRKDPLRIYLLNGYSRNISFSYTAPYSNKALSEGFTVAGGYTQNREIVYADSSNSTQLFYPNDSATKKRSEFVRNSWYFAGGYIIRRGLFKKHIFSAGYTHLKVVDSIILKYNPNYFGTANTSKGYVDLMYTYQYVNVDNVLYPLKGIGSYFTIQKRGLGLTGGINMLSLEGGWNKYYPLRKNWYANTQLSAKIKLPFEQAFINQRGLGYNENYLRGLEYYVVDGVVTGLLRTTLKKKVYSFNVPVPFKFLHRIATSIPFTFYAKTYADIGYVYTKKKYDTYLDNRLLYSGGFGLDILTLYDVNIRLEYSFNQLNERGFFFHSQSGF